MDFLTDPIFTDLGRSDFIGGIDNEALDFGHLEQFMHAAASASGGATAPEINGNIYIVGSVPKAEPSAATTMPSSSAPISNTNRNIATVSARVSLATTATPIAAPLVAAAISSNTQTHLPESPPDSGSEPPYSPLQEVHGLTLTTHSDLAATNGSGLYSGLSVASAVPTPHPQQPLSLQSPVAQMSAQFTPPHTQNYHLPHPHTHPHPHPNNPFPHHSNNNQSQAHYLNNTTALRIGAERNVTEINIKHEGLVMHESNMAAAQPGTSETHIGIATPHQSTLYPSSIGTELKFDSETTALYTAEDYQHIGTAGTLNQAAICLMNPETATPRVHVIGTSTPQPQSSRSSAPSTPIHRSSTRKRKMSTQIDCADFADPGLRITPVGKSNGRTAQYSFASDPQQLGHISPVTVSLPTSSAEMATPALSSASLSPALSTVNSNQENSMDGSVAPSTSGDIIDPNALTPCIRFTPFQPQNWHKLCDQSLQELSVVYYRVDADKGFNFSISDDAFVCQKKNHFQVTCHARLQGEAKFVKTPSGLEKIKAFHLHFYGVKLEAPNQTIRVEQSQSDRSKKPFHPVLIDLQSHIVSKITVGRLHFSETTNNNMRKKGRPNPEQRYFQLVVGLHVHTISGNFPIISQGSERIIVRASNPGQFESDVDLCWQRGITQDSIFHAGRVGINTDRPDESLVVHGNLKVSGHIVQPSDSRAKQEIGELDTSVQLRNLQKIRIVRYRYEPEFAIHSGLRRASATDNEEIVDTGVIAQEVREVIPDAVQEAGSITLPNGNVIENFLLVNKDRILMENIGAVKELCKVTGSLESRIQSLELMNHRLLRAKDYNQRTILEREANMPKNSEMCSNRNLQIIILLLVIIMAACLTAVSTLYFLEHNKQHHNYISLEHLKQHTPSGYHDTSLLGEQERHFTQLRNFLHSNASKTQGAWPDYLLGLTSPRPPPATAPRNTSSSSSHGQEIAYNESGEFYAAHGRTDELTVVMDKPVLSLQPLHVLQMKYRVTTSAPPPTRSNKAIGSKNKHKWPLPEVVLRAATGLATGNNDFVRSVVPVAGNIVEEVSTAAVLKSEYEEVRALHVNETTTSRKQSGDLIPQDFENNSIDIVDARRESRKKSPGNKISPASVLSKTASHESTVVVVDSADSGSLKILVDGQRKHQDPITSTASSKSVGVPYTTAATKLRPGGSESANIYNVYKAISTPITTHRTASNLTGSLSLEPPKSSGGSNKSQGVLDATLVDTGDALDLQSLSNNNESADNPIAALFGIDLTPRDSVLSRGSSTGQRSANIWMQRQRIELEPFGAPVQCRQSSLRDDISNCQSVCFEGSNQLSAPRKHSLSSPSNKNKNPVHERQPQNVDSSVEDVDVEIDAEPADEIDESHKLTSYDDKKDSHRNGSSIAPGKVSHATQAIAKQFPTEHLSDDFDSLEALIELPGAISIVANRPPALNCWKISSRILAEGLNDTYGIDDFCPTTGRSLNLTYVIPMSKYFKEPSFELRFSSSIPLLWAICHDSDSIKRDGKLLPPAQRGNHLPREQNHSILGLLIPSHGYFVRELELRVSDDLTKENLCQQEADETNTLLQYNIRILRDCD